MGAVVPVTVTSPSPVTYKICGQNLTVLTNSETISVHQEHGEQAAQEEWRTRKQNTRTQLPRGWHTPATQPSDSPEMRLRNSANWNVFIVFDSYQDRRFPFHFHGRIFASESTERELRLLHLMTRVYMQPGLPAYCISWNSSVMFPTKQRQSCKNFSSTQQQYMLLHT